MIRLETIYDRGGAVTLKAGPSAAQNDLPPADGRTRSAVDARHVRSFTEREILRILGEEVIRQAGHDAARVTGSSTKLVSPANLTSITIKVEVKENS